MKKVEKAYCDVCNDEVEYEVRVEKNTLRVKELTFEAVEHIAYCKKCGEQLWVDELERRNDIVVYDIYKEKVGLLTTSQIREIRHKRGMTQKELALFLGIGEKDIARYENGAIQSRSIDNMIRLVGDEHAYLEMARVFANTKKIRKTS